MGLLRSRDRLALLLLLLLAFGLGLFRLDGQSLWYDEGVTAAIARRGLDELTRWTANDIQPPLYYYVVAGWGRLAGWSEWSLRFPSAWFNVLTVAFLALLARRLTGSNRAALVAALLAALHPLLVYYAQEARMYAQLTALGALAGYLLARLASQGQQQAWRIWLAYVGVAVAAIYTHYFAFFLLLALGLAYGIDWALARRASGPAGGMRQRLLAFLGAEAAILLLFVPWLSALFTRLQIDRSYWEGTLKLHEALLDVAIGFTSGETVLERWAAWLLIPYGLITVSAVWRLWRAGAAGRRTLRWGLFWLVAPVTAVLLLAVNVPKFNARYVMVALPGLLLLWAGGLGLERQTGPAGAPRLRDRWGAAAASLILAGFAFGVLGWYFDPAFTKDQWRELVAFLRPRLDTDERIVLVSGHAWPVWDYYAPDLAPVRLPDLQILDVDAVLDFATSGPPLQAAYAEETGMRGAWLVGWQDEVVDPNGVVPMQLELSGREKGQSVTFYGLSLRRYSNLRPFRFVTAPPIDHVLDANLGGQVILRGFKAVDNGDLLLFWQRAPGADNADLHFALHSFTEEGTQLAAPPDRRLAGYTYPFARWRDGEVVAALVPATAWLGETPAPGRYRVTLRVYDGNDPAALPLHAPDGSDQLEVGPIEVVIS